jgi:hypothetical protein
MIGVVVHLEDRWNYTQSDRDIDVAQMYRETIKAFGADTFIIIDLTTEGLFYKHSDAAIAFASYKSLNDALSAYPDTVKFFFEHPDSIPAGTNYITLDNLVHPVDNVLYVFGGDQTSLNFSTIPIGANDKIVAITISKYVLWGLAAVATAMYDRYLKVK